MSEPSNYRRILRHSTVGIEMGLSVVVGLLLGWALDRWLETSPLFLLVCLILGFAAGFRSLLRAVRRMREELRGDGDPSP